MPAIHVCTTVSCARRSVSTVRERIDTSPCCRKARLPRRARFNELAMSLGIKYPTCKNRLTCQALSSRCTHLPGMDTQIPSSSMNKTNLDNLPPSVVSTIARHLRDAAESTPLHTYPCRCTKETSRAPPPASETYQISPTDPAYHLSRVSRSLKGIMEEEVKREFRTSYCGLGIKQSRRGSEGLRENVGMFLSACWSVHAYRERPNAPCHRRTLKISAGSQHASPATIHLRNLISLFPNTDSLHISWSYAKGKSLIRFPATPASPETTFPKITSLTLDFRGQRIEQAFGVGVVPSLLQHLHMPNVRSLTILMEPADHRQYVDDDEWTRLKRVCRKIRFPGLEKFHLGIQVPVIKDSKTMLFVSINLASPSYRCLTLIFRFVSRCRASILPTSNKPSAPSRKTPLSNTSPLTSSTNYTQNRGSENPGSSLTKKTTSRWTSSRTRGR